MRTRRICLPIALSAILLGAIPACGAAGASLVAESAASTECAARNVPSGSHFVYYTLLSAKGVGCATRNRVEDKFQNCRLKHGLRGRCHSKEVGFSCQEVGPRQPNAVAFNAKVSCSRGSAKFTYAYEQN